MTKTDDLIAEFGWCVIKVPEDDDGPGFAYTVGLTQSFRHPELFLQGLPLKLMHQILNAAGEKIREGARFAVGGRVSDLIEDDVCGVRAFPRDKHDAYLSQALAHAGDDGVDALQLTWPDRNHRQPDDEGCDDEVRRLQDPSLG